MSAVFHAGQKEVSGHAIQNDTIFRDYSAFARRQETTFGAGSCYGPRSVGQDRL
jgi:hypothetical protein